MMRVFLKAPSVTIKKAVNAKDSVKGANRLTLASLSAALWAYMFGCRLTFCMLVA